MMLIGELDYSLYLLFKPKECIFTRKVEKKKLDATEIIFGIHFFQKYFSLALY